MCHPIALHGLALWPTSAAATASETDAFLLDAYSRSVSDVVESVGPSVVLLGVRHDMNGIVAAAGR
ncbi:MAG: hypothetical protein ACYC5H_12640 [Methylovirgula sp.]